MKRHALLVLVAVLALAGGFVPVRASSIAVPSWRVELDRLIASPAAAAVMARMKVIVANPAASAALEAQMSKTFDAYRGTEPSLEQFTADAADAFSMPVGAGKTPGTLPSLSALIQSPEFVEVVSSLRKISADPAFAQLAYHRLPTMSRRAPWDTFVNVARNFVTFAVGAAVVAACTATVALGCGPAIVVGGSIIGVFELAVDKVNELRSNGKGHRISGMTCTTASCAFTGQAFSERWLVSGMHGHWNFVDDPVSPKASSSATGSAGWRKTATDPNLWDIWGESTYDPRHRCYEWVQLHVLVYWTDGQYTSDSMTGKNPYYQPC